MLRDQVQIHPTSAADTLTNLADAINGTGAAGTNYTTEPTANTSVTVPWNRHSDVNSRPVGNRRRQHRHDGYVGYLWRNNAFRRDSGDRAAAPPPPGTLTTTANATAGQTVTIGGTTYTFESTLDSSTPDEVQIDPTSAANTLTNLAHAINGTGAAGNDWINCTGDSRAERNRKRINFDVNGVPVRDGRQQYRDHVNLGLIRRKHFDRRHYGNFERYRG